jgi:two-component system, NtrC family, sensor kinase
MGQRSKAPGKRYTKPRRKSVRPKRRSGSKAARPQLAGAVVPDPDAARLRRELEEALAQQAATAKVLEVISRSAFDLQAVFDAVVESSARLCAAERAFFFRLEGELLRTTATYNVSAEVNEWFERNPIRVDGKSITGRSALKRRTISVTDVLADLNYKFPAKAIETYRSFLAVPVLKGTDLLGVISLYHPEVKPFTDMQVAVVETFAHQAAIAIENVRLFEAEQQRSRELTESLEQQTATAEVLRVISSSPGDLQPVFEAMLENAVRICGASFGSMFLFEGEHLRRVSMHNAPASYAEYAASKPVIHYSVSGDIRRVRNTRRPEQTPDLLAEDLNDPLAKFAGARTVVTMPMLKHDELIGIITIYRREVRPFTDKQVELLTNFAAQAVIAIENARLLSELRESLEHQTASSEVLQAINASPGDLAPVFGAIVDKAMHLCEAGFGGLWVVDGDLARVAATNNLPEPFAEFLTRAPMSHADAFGRGIQDRPLVHIADIAATESYRKRVPMTVASVELGGVRTYLAVPLRQGGELAGVLILYRKEVRPFNDRQIALVQGFAAQAEIAMKNARLLTETRESLEQQTATSEVLSIINASPTDLAPVFDAMIEKALRLCQAKYGGLAIFEDDHYRALSTRGLPEQLKAFVTQRVYINPESAPDRLRRGEDVVHVRDIANTSALPRTPGLQAMIEANARTSLWVSLRKDDAVVGFFAIYRQEVYPFSEREIGLVRNFAAQAVIAIENARLLSELRESLEQQTATAEVLSVISSSPGDLTPVFEAMLTNAARICDARFGGVYRWDGEFAQLVATTPDLPPAYAAVARYSPFRPDPEGLIGRSVVASTVTHIADMMVDDLYTKRRDPFTVAGVELGGMRTALVVPMLKDNEPIGFFAVTRHQVRPFTDKQTDLIKNFAAQAVIAIENTRLLTELHQRTDDLGRSVGELRALGEVSQAVNSTLDLQTVLETIVAKAVQLSSTDAGAIYVFDDAQQDFHLRATYGMDQDVIAALRDARLDAGDRNVAEILAEREVLQSADLSQGEITQVDRIVVGAGYRSRLTAPLVRGDDLVGLLVVRRRTPGSFPQNTVDLMKTFAAQSAVAIQNARLFENIETRTRELARSLQDLRTAQDRLIQTEKLASLGQLTAGIAHEIKNPLNFVNNFSSLSVELIDELQEALAAVTVDDKTRGEISELASMLRDNLGKVVQHGKRADSTVKNMLLHSRQGSGEHQPVDVNALVEESLNLAYHGARAERKGFNITLERSFDPAAGKVDLFPQEITRVLLNLISNGFYAATKRKADANGGYEPTLSAGTKDLGDRVEIRIRDNGTGIPPEVKEKMFNPFFTTKPAGEGTGLGLSLSHDIIVKQHAGSIEVDTQPGEFTEFRITLPRGAATIAKSGGSR